jgi:predicted  nucleic acid-binding Zn-ribbon protein
MSELANPPAPAPAPAPAAPPPSPAPAPAPSPFPAATPPADTGPDPFLEADKPFLDAIAKVDGQPPAAPAAPKGGTPPPKPAAAAPKPADKPKPDEKGSRGPAPELRKQYETLKAEHEAVKGKIPELEAKIADWERKGKDTEALQGRLQAMEKEKAELRAQLFVYDQTKSPEFIQRFQQPFNDAADMARDEIMTLEYKNDDETTRQATWDDFAKIYTTMSPSQAVTELRERFGASADLAIGHYRELTRIARIRDRAAADLRQNAEARMKEYEQRQATEKEQRTGLLGRVTKELAERVPEYHDDPADTEASSARKQGYELFDRDPQTPREAILKDAHVRHRFAAYSPLRLKVARLEAELAKLKGGKAPDPDADPGADNRRSSNGENTGKDDRTWEEQAMSELKQVQ